MRKWSDGNFLKYFESWVFNKKKSLQQGVDTCTINLFFKWPTPLNLKKSHKRQNFYFFVLFEIFMINVQIPSYFTTNPFISDLYAKHFFSFLNRIFKKFNFQVQSTHFLSPTYFWALRACKRFTNQPTI